MSQTKPGSALSDHPIVVGCAVIAGLATIVGTIILAYSFITGRTSLQQDMGASSIQSSPVETHASSLSPTNPETEQTISPFVAQSPLIINGTQYEVPTHFSQGCVAAEQTGYTGTGVDYQIVVPSGWTIVWDSWKAYWPDGEYEDDGLLVIFGDWQGMVSVVNGEYCAVPSEWSEFAINSRASAVSDPSRETYYLGEIP